jgi:hypothetical protein
MLRVGSRFCVRLAFIAAVTVPSTVAAQVLLGEGRFRDPAHITGDPTGMRLDPAVRVAPRYPDWAREVNRTGAPVVAFVVDTMGRVEPRTESFLNDSDRDFRQSVCELLPKLRFLPFIVEGQKWRVLLVQFYAFNTWQEPDSVGVARAQALARERQEYYGTQPLTAVLSELERLPHCDTLKEK